jgi:hypothetical protein
VEGVGNVGNSPGQGLAILTPVLVCFKIAFSVCIVAVVCLIYVLISETDISEGGIEKVNSKSLWRVSILTYSMALQP